MSSGLSRSGLSACVITYNEADRIEACIASLAFCDEIIVVDSHSTDATRALASAAGARVIERDWPGYRSQKQFAVETATHDWVLCLDADERISDSLRDEIIVLREQDFVGASGWKFPRCTEYFGRYLRHGNGYPDRVLRLFDRRCGAWAGREIHEHVEVQGTVARLRGELMHDAYRNLADQLRRLENYARLMAEHMHAKGRRAHWWNLLLNPGWRFFRGYILRGGFLDGWRGLILAYIEANYVRQKFIKLWLLNHDQKI